jgi:hypothetical protein
VTEKVVLWAENQADLFGHYFFNYLTYDSLIFCLQLVEFFAELAAFAHSVRIVAILTYKSVEVLVIAVYSSEILTAILPNVEV